MAEHDDDGTPPYTDLSGAFRGPGTRYIQAAEHEALRNRVHQVSNEVNAELGKLQSRTAVLEQRANDAEKRDARVDNSLETLRRECEERAHDTRKYAATLVDGAKTEARNMVDQLASTLAQARQDEREDRRAEASATMWRIGLMVVGLQFAAGAVITIGIAIWKH